MEKEQFIQTIDEEVLKRKNEFLAYNITIQKDENEKLTVEKIEQAEVNNK